MKPTRRLSISLVTEIRDVLMNVQSPHKWWSTLKSAVFGSISSLPPLVTEGGGLVCESVGKADLLSDHFDSKQSSEAVDLPLTCHPSPSFTTFAFRSSEVRCLLLNLDLMVAWTHWVCLIFFFKSANVMGPRFSVAFRRLVRLGSFPACWRQAMSPQFRKVHRPLLLPITDQFP